MYMFKKEIKVKFKKKLLIYKINKIKSFPKISLILLSLITLIKLLLIFISILQNYKSNNNNKLILYLKAPFKMPIILLIFKIFNHEVL